MKKTVVSHFYNEEYLLPWWLKHHRSIFDHGIMINYNSTDRSCEIIKELCPTWDIIPSRNEYFDGLLVDEEVQDIEETIQGWRTALNITEFLYGNYARMTDVEEQQIYLANYVFVDMLDNKEITHLIPLHEQCLWGYKDQGGPNQLNRGVRPRRSLHNYPIQYPVTGGRHFESPETHQDLCIFYYGYAILNDQSINRKVQIQQKMSDKERNSAPYDHPNKVDREKFLHRIKTHIRPQAKEISGQIAPMIELHKQLTGQEF